MPALAIIEGAYYMGFEPSSETLTQQELLAEAQYYCITHLLD